MTREFFQRLPRDLAKRFIVLKGFITPGIAKNRKMEPTAEDNSREHSRYSRAL